MPERIARLGWREAREPESTADYFLKAMPRVLFYSRTFWPQMGGVETYARLIAEGLAAKPGFEIVVATTSAPADDGKERDWPFVLERRPSPIRLWQLTRRADVVLTTGAFIPPMAVALLVGTPLVVGHHSYTAVCPSYHLLDKYRDQICSGAFQQGKYADCVRCCRVDLSLPDSLAEVSMTMVKNRLSKMARVNFAVSEHVRERIRFPDMQVIQLGVPLAEIVQQTPTGNPVEFGYSGRLVEVKGLFVLLEAAAILQSKGFDFRLTFIGEGPLQSALRDKARSMGLGDHVTFTGFLEGAELDRRMRSLDVLVMPSICEEAAGLSAIEQMMRGGAVIGSDLGGLSEVLGDGVKVRPRDAAGLAARMESLLDPELRAAAGRQGLERARQRFQVQRMIDEHADMLTAASRHGTA